MSAASIPLGRFSGISNEEYHATHAVSASKLRDFAEEPGGPWLYHGKHITKTIPRVETEAMAFGTALHCAILEPEKFFSEYAILPSDAPARPTEKMLTAKKPAPETIEKILWWERFHADNKGRKILSADDYDAIAATQANIIQHPEASELLSKGEAEVTWRTMVGGCKDLPPIQCRTDWFNQEGSELSEGRPYVVDLKTCRKITEFSNSSADHLYHVQAALYMTTFGNLGVECRDFFFFSLAKSEGKFVKVWRLGERELQEGQELAASLLMRLDECYRTNTWPGSPAGIHTLKLPAWYWSQKFSNLETTT